MSVRNFTGGRPPAAPVASTPAVMAVDGKETDGGSRAATATPGGHWAVLAVLAAAAIGLAAVAVVRRRPPEPPSPPVMDPGGWGLWTGW